MIPVTRSRIVLAVSVLLLPACAAVPELTFESSDASADAGDASDSARDASPDACGAPCKGSGCSDSCAACAATCQSGDVCCGKANGGVLCKQADQACPP